MVRAKGTAQPKPFTGALYLLVSILLVGTLLRIYNLGLPPIAEDEAYHAVTALAWAETGMPVPPSGRPYTRGLPLIFLEKLSLQYLPLEFEWALRLPVALLGILNVYLCYLAGRTLASVPVGLASAAFFAVSPWAIYYGTHLRMYELLVTAVLLSVICLHSFVRQPTLAKWLALMLALGLGITAHQEFLVVCGLPLAAAVVNYDRPIPAVLLALTTAVSVTFWFAYTQLLRAALPIPVEYLASLGGGPSIVLPPFDLALRMLPEAGWLWVASLVVTAGLFVVFFVRHMRYFGLWVLASYALILIWGLAGFLTIAVLILIGIFIASRLWIMDSAMAQRARLWASLWFVYVIAVWMAVAVLGTVLPESAAGASGATNAVKGLWRYPDIYYRVVVPLIADPQVTVVFQYGLFATLLLTISQVVYIQKSSMDRALATHIIFLVSAAGLLGITETYYSASRYLYFLFPIALLALLQGVIGCRALSSTPSRKQVMVALFAVIVMFEAYASVKQVPGGDQQYRGIGGNTSLPHVKLEKRHSAFRHKINYREIGRVLNDSMADGDLLLADAAHQLQVYVEKIHGHLTPPLKEYRLGTHHYFTGSQYLRSVAELQDFVEANVEDSPYTYVWFVLTGYRSQWTTTVPEMLIGGRVWASDHAEVFRVSGRDLVAALGERELFP